MRGGGNFFPEIGMNTSTFVRKPNEACDALLSELLFWQHNTTTSNSLPQLQEYLQYADCMIVQHRQSNHAAAAQCSITKNIETASQVQQQQHEG